MLDKVWRYKDEKSCDSASHEYTSLVEWMSAQHARQWEVPLKMLFIGLNTDA